MELDEAVSLASLTRYLSTVLHGNGYDHDECTAETDEIFEYLRERHREAAGD